MVGPKGLSSSVAWEWQKGHSPPSASMISSTAIRPPALGTRSGGARPMLASLTRPKSLIQVVLRRLPEIKDVDRHHSGAVCPRGLGFAK